MVTLRKENGRFVCISDEFIPVPHSLTRVIKESGNYGLADEARQQFKELSLKEGEIPGPVRKNETKENTTMKTVGIGRGRGRGRGRIIPQQPESSLETSHEIPARRFHAEGDKRLATAYQMFYSGIKDNFCDELDACSSYNKDQTSNGKGLSAVDEQNIWKPDEHRDDPERRGNVETDELNFYEIKKPASTSTTSTVPRAPTPTPQNLSSLVKAGKLKAGGGKTNGYCLFLKHMGRKSGVTGTINELMRQFDKNWKMLPDEEKKAWKTRAKTGSLPPPPPPNTTGRYNRYGEAPQRRLSSASSISTMTTTTTTTDQTSSSDESY